MKTKWKETELAHQSVEAYCKLQYTKTIMLSFSFGGCVSPSRTNAEACFRAGPMRSHTDVWCCVAPIAATDGACMYVLRYPALSLVQARRIG